MINKLYFQWREKNKESIILIKENTNNITTLQSCEWVVDIWVREVGAPNPQKGDKLERKIRNLLNSLRTCWELFQKHPRSHSSLSIRERLNQDSKWVCPQKFHHISSQTTANSIRILTEILTFLNCKILGRWFNNSKKNRRQISKLTMVKTIRMEVNKASNNLKKNRIYQVQDITLRVNRHTIFSLLRTAKISVFLRKPYLLAPFMSKREENYDDSLKSY